MHVDLIGQYGKYIIQQNPGGTIAKNNISLTCMMIIYPDKGWFKIIEIPTYNINEVTGGDDDYIDT